jgi:hypothetical protein
MADKLDQFEAIFGAISKITTGDVDPEMRDARCPKCNASDFMQVPDLYADAVGRIEDSPEAAEAINAGGLTNAQIVAKFQPPQRRSPLIPVLVVALPLVAAAVYVYQRFGPTPGQSVGLGTFVVTVAVFLTTLRKRGDEYYDARRQWRSLFICRKCGQLVSS